MPQAVSTSAIRQQRQDQAQPPQGCCPMTLSHIQRGAIPQSGQHPRGPTSLPALFSLLFLLLASTASTTPFVGHSLLVVDILLAPESSNWRSIGELGKSAQPWYPTSVSLLSYLITCPSTDCFQYISDCLYRVQPGLLILNLTGRAFIHAIYTSCMAVVSPICECI